MGTKSEKLVLLALVSENVEEAVAALRKARQQQPKGKLQINIDQGWDDLRRERSAFQAERDAFEAERRDYQKRILSGEQERADRNAWRDLGAYALVLGKPAAALLLVVGLATSMSAGTAALGGASDTRTALAERICDAVGTTILVTCDS